MGLLTDSLERAEAAHLTRPLPKTARAQMRYLTKQTKGTRAAAQLLGVSQRTVERYLKGQIKNPRPDLAQRLADEVRKRWQPRVRATARKQAATTGGIVIDTRARFGFTADPGTTDDARLRAITQALPPAYAARLFDAHAAGADDRQLQNILAEGLQEIYFKDRGRRADGLQVEFTDLDYLDVDY
ncbi:telomere-protecting terminal protein Tpg [Streptomyces endophyticus]|uniref:Helix-turn-helix domain-containing protein n=1 Tax=Streptomyces endophyticus TaxID=714166 RepID=A0ABU6FEV4_9ACTN|nr:helix-turn-helix domain-containing protein [Streptomyces endophyticus]MEB8342576.1 helix-turn-helix domain-containing protein [Streptomyces endophyticus]